MLWLWRMPSLRIYLLTRRSIGKRWRLFLGFVFVTDTSALRDWLQFDCVNVFALGVVSELVIGALTNPFVINLCCTEYSPCD
jgi:hypothetical protein